MLFDMKSVVLYGLMALVHASPLSDLSKRAKLGDFQCPDDTLSEHDIREALHECRRLDDGSIGKYPAFFGNKSNNQKVFGNIPDGTDLREFPIIVGGVYSGGEPGPCRVVTDYKDNRDDFRGVMQYTEPGRDKDDKNKHDKDEGDMKSNNEERSVQETETEVEEPTGHIVSDLTTRSKKRRLGSATCTDGVTLSHDDVVNAFRECKKWDDHGRGGYPHKFGNKSGNSQVFEGITKDLREYPIIQSGTWTGGEPGKYRVVTDYKDNFEGVMIEHAGVSFSRCTINKD
ncbi:hypothetical protein KXX49_008078 [Aspergillus fumigatus]|nr:hypothetical protein KXX49_008078 [Aspergillus fumigatus]